MRDPLQQEMIYLILGSFFTSPLTFFRLKKKVDLPKHFLLKHTCLGLFLEGWNLNLDERWQWSVTELHLLFFCSLMFRIIWALLCEVLKEFTEIFIPSLTSSYSNCSSKANRDLASQSKRCFRAGNKCPNQLKFQQVIVKWCKIIYISPENPCDLNSRSITESLIFKGYWRFWSVSLERQQPWKGLSSLRLYWTGEEGRMICWVMTTFCCRKSFLHTSRIYFHNK